MEFSNGYWDAAVKTVDQDTISCIRLQNLKILDMVKLETIP